MLRFIKQFSISLFLLSVGLWQVGCNSDSVDPDNIGNWYNETVIDFEGVGRRSAVAFAINNLGFVGTGYDSDNDRLRDFWSYDPSLGAWTSIADFGGSARNDAVAFVIGTKAYVGTGYDDDYKKDFWEYDFTGNKWTKISDFGTTADGSTIASATARQYASAFSLNGKGYVGLGFDDNYKQDFYEYNPTTDSWRQIMSFPGGKRRGASAFSIDNFGYVAFGYANSGINEEDMWQFNPSANDGKGEWIEKEDLEDYPRAFAVPLVIDGKVYIVGGTNASDVWEYNPTSDAWQQKTSFEGGSRSYAVGFVIGNRGYYGTGISGSMLDDFWGFDPAATQVDDD
jgi:N-acetylneuraminic acid mutarotase